METEVLGDGRRYITHSRSLAIDKVNQSMFQTEPKVYQTNNLAIILPKGIRIRYPLMVYQCNIACRLVCLSTTK